MPQQHFAPASPARASRTRRALTTLSTTTTRPRTALALLIGLIGLAAGLVLPFAPVLAERAELTWPAPGRPAVSSTAILVPYRPAELTAAVPCPVLLAAAARNSPTTVLATGGSTDAGAGLLVRVDGGLASVLVNARLVAQSPVSAVGPDCAARVVADQYGVGVSLAGRTEQFYGEPVPEVALLRTDLDPGAAGGLTVNARTVNPFDTVPTGLKTTLLVIQLSAAGFALVLLGRRYPKGRERPSGRARPSVHGRWVDGGVAAVDGGVAAVLAGWAVIGPLSDDDGFVTMIARNSLVAGDTGNYYRWWSASESPFTLVQRVVAVLSEVSLQPLWLRLPSTVMGAAAWLVLSRGVLGAVPGFAGARARALLAVCFLAAWLPYNLGVRPEPFVALGAVVVLALLIRGRGPAALGLATLVAAVTATASPSGLLALAAVPVFAGRIVRMLRAAPDDSDGPSGNGPSGNGPSGNGPSGNGPGTGTAVERTEVVARLALVGAVGAVGMSVVFGDQSLHGLVTATRWHAEFSPSLPWYLEVQRYRYLLGEYQDGNALKRVPVLLSLALLPVMALLLARRTSAAETNDPTRDELEWAAGKLAGCVAVGLALLWLTPSKWTLYFGSLAGTFAAFLAVATVLLARRARDGSLPMRLALLGGGLVALAAGLSFAGTNDWWQPVLYDVPWHAGPVRPAGLPIDLPPFWAGAALLVAAALWLAKGAPRGERALLVTPAVLTAVAAGTALAVLLGSFLSAPLRRPEASLARINLHEVGGHGCGLADHIEALPDVPSGVLTPADPSDPGELIGFVAGAGWRPDRPPPDSPGVRASAQVWGSRVDDDPTRTGRLVSPWFTLPALTGSQEIALTVSGRTDQGNRLTLEFGAGPRSLGERRPTDQPHVEAVRIGETTRPDPSLWRSVWLARDQIPAGADRVRVLAADGTADPGGWLALTGPRLRAPVRLPDYLAGTGPVLVNWPIAFLFPCIRDVVTVAHGIAGAPRAVLQPARRYAGLGGQSTDPGVAGVFAAVHSMGRLGEVPTRVVGRPDLAWGSLLLADYRGAARDGYQLTLNRVRMSGSRGDSAQIVTDRDGSGAARGR